MRPLNGKCAMTREERNARRRELMQNPFYAELIHKRDRAYWAKNAAKKSAQRKARLEAMPSEEREAFVAKRREQARARRAKNREKYRLRQIEWRKRNRDKVKEYRKAKYRRDIASGKQAIRLARNEELRRQKTASDPEYRKRLAECKRRWSRSPNGLDLRRRQMMANWVKVAAGGADRIKVFMTHAKPENRRAFSQWYQQRLINRTDGLGHIEEEREDK